MRMTRAQWDELIAHAQGGGAERVLRLRARQGRRRRRVYRAVNERHSPYGFEFGFSALNATNELDDEGWEVATYHSHPRSAAEPSQTDINLATYPNWTYLIVSLDGDPHVRAWRIVDGKVDEQPIELDG